MSDHILRSPDLDKKLLAYILAVTHESEGWWEETLAGSFLSRRSLVAEWRARYDAQRSTMSLDRDVKEEPFKGASNFGIGAEQIAGEFLVPVMLTNTVGLTPMLQALDLDTEQIDEPLTTFHDRYQRYELAESLALREDSTREVFKVGGVFHKWTYGTLWKQREIDLTVFAHPLTNQPVLQPDPGTGGLEPIPADPKMPEELWPVDPATGLKLKIAKIPSVNFDLLKEGPQLSIRPIEAIEFPPSARTVDPNTWDWVADNFTVSPWWFLGREGDPFDGKLQNLDKLWKWLGVDPNNLHLKPDGKTLTQPVKLKEVHTKFPVTSSGKPVEIIALVATEANLLLAWRVSPFPRRPFFNRQVWNRGGHPLGKGIPETVRGIRDALDKSVNQDTDAGDLYNHPPTLLSTLAYVDDEDYEQTGPGTILMVRDINGMKVLAQPPALRNPMERENWLFSMIQRLWGVTDLNLSAPTSSLSPNIQTATAALATLNQGSIKFGHLTRRLSETDSQEFQFCHELFRTMLANPKTISVTGQPMVIAPKDREQFFHVNRRIVAIGNGVSTNPIMRQRALSEGWLFIKDNPYIGGDLDVLKDYTEQWLESMGIKLTLKEPQMLQQLQVIQQLLQTAPGQAVIPAAVQQVIGQLQAMEPPTNGRDHVASPASVGR